MANLTRSRRSFLGAIPALIALPFVVPGKEEIITKQGLEALRWQVKARIHALNYGMSTKTYLQADQEMSRLLSQKLSFWEPTGNHL